MKNITYTEITEGSPFQGMTLTGGEPVIHQGKAVVRFSPTLVKGKKVNPNLLLESRPDLQHLADEWRKEKARELERASWRPLGYKQIQEVKGKIDEARTRFEKAYRREETLEQDWAKRDEVTARAELEHLARQYPAAWLWEQAEALERGASWSDPTGKAQAAMECKRILRDGGSLTDAEKALGKRREVDPWL